MPKSILRGNAARQALLRGIDCLADAVKVTLGPQGRLAIISRRAIGQTPQATKDGVTVASWVSPNDPHEQIGSDLVYEAAEKTRKEAGDGTTTCAVLAQALTHAGMKQIDAGNSPASLCVGIGKAVEEVCEALRKMAIPADTDERLLQVATIASNGDSQIAALILQAIKHVGKDGVMICDQSNSTETVLDFVAGMQMRKGMLTPHFITDTNRMECIFEDAIIFCHEAKIESAKSLVSLIKLANAEGRPLLVIAGDYSQEAIATFVQNNGKGFFRCCIVRADAWGPRRAEVLRDIACMTGGKAFTEDLGTKLDNVTAEFFGRAKKVTVSEHRTTITEGNGKSEAIANRAEDIRKAIAKADASQIPLLQARLAGLTGGVAILRVGGVTESEMKERKDRVEDAMFATKAAAEEGILPGGGLALLNVGKSLPPYMQPVMLKVCECPAMQILNNAGINNFSSEHPSYWLNAATMETENLIISGIVDPLKVVREALVNAASVACTILRTECLIADVPEQK